MESFYAKIRRKSIGSDADCLPRTPTRALDGFTRACYKFQPALIFWRRWMNLSRTPTLILVLLAIAPIASAQAQSNPDKTKKEIQITRLGHAAFEVVSSGGTRILIDPFIKENPPTPAERKDLSRYKPNFILVTHSHGDQQIFQA